MTEQIKVWSTKTSKVLGFVLREGNFSMYCKLWLPQAEFDKLDSAVEMYKDILLTSSFDKIAEMFSFHSEIWNDKVYYNLNLKGDE